MPKQNNELARRVESVHAELILSPAMQSQTVVDRATVEEMVARQVAEMLTKSETAIFEPFFRNRQVAYALRRLQSIPEQRVHALRYERLGCMVCKRDDEPHNSLGMCHRCYSRESQLRKKLLKELIEAYDAGRRIVWH
jgi:hypothetical protein